MLQENSSQLVGFVNGQLDWHFLLKESVTENVHDVVAVIMTDSVSATYHISQGNQVDFVAIGDAHEPSCSRHDRTETFKLGASTSGLTVTFYACDAYFEDNSTEIPMIASIVVAGTFLIVIAVFLTYDSMVRYGFLYEQALLETKRNFVRYTSHEIRTPLNTVVLGLKLFGMEVDHLLEEDNAIGELPYPIASFLTEVVKNWRDLTNDMLGNTESAVDILNDLLNYDKVEAGTLRLEFASVSIPDIVQTTIAAFTTQSQQKSINIQCKSNIEKFDLPASTKLYSIGDTARLSQVMRNFLSNALKFTPPNGNIDVEVEWLPEEELGSARPVEVPEEFGALLENPRAGVVRVSVTDSGAGLSAEQLAQVGGDGVQFNASKLQGGGGSGVGLFLTKSIIEQHGGMMRVSSQGLDQGSTFSFDLPLFAGDMENNGVNSQNASRSFFSHYGTNDRSVHTAPFDANFVTSTGASSAVSPTSFGGSQKASSAENAAATADKSADGPPPADIRASSTNDMPSIVQTLSSNNISQIPGAAVNPVGNAVTTTTNYEPKHLLIVNDAPSNRRLLMRILTIKGYTCEDADNGQKAIDKYKEILARKGKVDAILMDFQMPVMDGPTATKHLRAMGCRCFIVGVTGNVMQDDIDHYKKHGADAVLGKPLNTDAFESLFKTFNPSFARSQSISMGRGDSSSLSRSSRRISSVKSSHRQVLPAESSLSVTTMAAAPTATSAAAATALSAGPGRRQVPLLQHGQGQRQGRGETREDGGQRQQGLNQIPPLSLDLPV